MDRNFRKKTLVYLLKSAGLVSDIVKKTMNGDTSSSFKEAFLNTPPGPAREALVYKEIITRKPPLNMVPITVDAPGGYKITYKVMPDFISIDGIRVPMSGVTAQKVADYYGMSLPTSKMSKQIWDAADTKIRPTPLSAGGVINGKYYTGKEVVDHKISDSDSSVAYSQMIEDELKKHPPGTLIAGHMKDLVQPEGGPNKLGLYGWYGTDGKPLQYSARTPHDTTIHTEYGAGVRLVDNPVTVTTPDGQKINTTLDKVLSDPTLAKAVTTMAGPTRY